MVFQHHWRAIPMDAHLLGEGDFWRRPTDTAQAVVKLPFCTAFYRLDFESHRSIPKDLGHFFLAQYGAVHRTRPQRTVEMAIQVDQQPVDAAAQVEQRRTPRASIIGPEWRID